MYSIYIVLISSTLFLAVLGLNEGVRNIPLENEDKFLLECSYDDCFEDIVFDCGDDYILRVIVQSVNIDGDNGDFLLIKSGSRIDDGLTGRIFTHHINRQRRFVSINNHLFIRFHRNDMSREPSDTHAGFSLAVQRFGSRQNNSIFQPSTEIPEYVLSNLTVYMTILITPFEVNTITFNRTLEKMAGKMAIMADDYVRREDVNLTLSGDISKKNVSILRILQCPLEWPRRDTCFQIVFAIPITQYENSPYYGTHQLNTHHLARMWEQAPCYFDASSDIQIYDEQHRRNFVPWLIAILSFTALFAVFYMLIGDFCSNKIREQMFPKVKQEPDEKPDNIVQDPDLVKFDPHPFQQIPPLFESEVTFYEPDSKMHLRKFSGLQISRPSLGEGLVNSNNMNYFEIEGMQPRRETTSRKNYDVLP